MVGLYFSDAPIPLTSDKLGNSHKSISTTKYHRPTQMIPVAHLIFLRLSQGASLKAATCTLKMSSSLHPQTPNFTVFTAISETMPPPNQMPDNLNNSLPHILIHTEEPIALPGPQKCGPESGQTTHVCFFHPDSCTYGGTIAIWTLNNNVVKNLEGMSRHAIQILPKLIHPYPWTCTKSGPHLHLD